MCNVFNNNKHMEKNGFKKGAMTLLAHFCCKFTLAGKFPYHSSSQETHSWVLQYVITVITKTHN